MGHLLDQPDSLLQRVFQCAQRTIAIAVVGCAALALWAGSATAADNPAPGAAAPQSQAPTPPPVDPQPAAAPAAQTQAPAPIAEAPAPAPAPATPAAEAPAVPELPLEAPAASQVAVPAATPEAPASNPTSTVSETVHSVNSGAASVKTGAPAAGTPKVAGADALPGDDTVAQTLTQATDSAGVDAAVPGLGAVEDTAGQLPGELGNRDLLRDEWTSLLSSGAGAISATIEGLASILNDGPVSAAILPANGSPSAGLSTTPAANGSAPGLPGFPPPIQIPVLGSAGGSSTSSSGLFFFGFAGLLVGLWAAFAPAIGRRLQGPPAGWRPAPYLSLLELPG